MWQKAFQDGNKVGVNDIPSRPGREAEATVVGVDAAEETTAIVNPVERTEDAHMHKRRRTNPVPVYVLSTKVWHHRPTQTEVPKLAPRKPPAKRQAHKRTRQAAEQNCDANKQVNKRPAESETVSSESCKTKQAASMGAKIKGRQQTSSRDIRSFFVFGQSRKAHKATSTGQAAQCTPKRHKAQGEPAKEMPSLKGLCWNVRGLTTVLHELTHLVEQYAPDFVILTETKLRKTSRYRKKLTEALEDYVVHTSCKRDTPDMREGERTGAAGVAIAIHKKLAAHGSLKVTPLNAPAASGHCQRVCLQPTGSDAVDIWAVYMPHDMAVRRQVYQVLTSNATGHNNFIMAGDWNAAYLATDRCTGELQRPADEEHAQLLQTLQMKPTDEGLEDNSRQHTFYAEGQQQHHSRIDDFTWSKTLQTSRKATTSVLKAVTGDSDHYPLLADIPLDNISFVPPGPELPQPDRTARIKWPATQKQLHDYKMQTEMRVGQAARKEATAMREAIRMADETIGSKSPTEGLRLNKKDELRAAGLTKEMVLSHATKVSDMLKDV